MVGLTQLVLQALRAHGRVLGRPDEAVLQRRLLGLSEEEGICGRAGYGRGAVQLRKQLVVRQQVLRVVHHGLSCEAACKQARRGRRRNMRMRSQQGPRAKDPPQHTARCCMRIGPWQAQDTAGLLTCAVVGAMSLVCGQPQWVRVQGKRETAASLGDRDLRIETGHSAASAPLLSLHVCVC